MFFKEEISKIGTFELSCRVIDEVSELDLTQVEEEVRKNSNKWIFYMNLV